MATYDPNRTRRGPSSDPADDDVTQVDAILDRTSDGDIPAVPIGPGAEVPAAVVAPPEPEVDPEPEVAPEPEPSTSPEPEPGPEPQPEPEAPRAAPPASGVVDAVPLPAPERSLQRLAVVTGVAAATAAAIWLFRRRRNG